MKKVQPIRNIDVFEQCYQIARRHDQHRPTNAACWELLLVVGLNTSLRISDLTRFRIRDLRGCEYAQIVTRKTGKEARIMINPAARKEVNRLTAGRDPDEYAFQSRQED